MGKWTYFISYVIMLQIMSVDANFTFTFSIQNMTCSNDNNGTLYIIPTNRSNNYGVFRPQCFIDIEHQLPLEQDCIRDCPFFNTRCPYTATVNHTGCTIETTVEKEYKALLFVFQEDTGSGLGMLQHFDEYKFGNDSLSSLSITVQSTTIGTPSFTIEASEECSPGFCGQNCSEAMNNGCTCQTDRDTICTSSSPRVTTAVFAQTTNITSRMPTIQSTESSVISTFMGTTIMELTTLSSSNSTTTSITPMESNSTQSNVKPSVSNSKDLVVGLSVTFTIAFIVIIVALIVCLCKHYGQGITNGSTEDKTTDVEKLITNESISSNALNGSGRSISPDNGSVQISERSRSESRTVVSTSSHASISDDIPTVSTIRQKTDCTSKDDTSDIKTHQNSDKTNKNKGKGKGKENKKEETPMQVPSKDPNIANQQNSDDEKDEESNHNLSDGNIEQEQPFGTVQDTQLDDAVPNVQDKNLEQHNSDVSNQIKVIGGNVGTEPPSRTVQGEHLLEAPPGAQDDNIGNRTSTQNIPYEQKHNYLSSKDSGISRTVADESIELPYNYTEYRNRRPLLPDELRDRKVMLNNFIQVNDSGTIQSPAGISNPIKEDRGSSAQICTDNHIQNSPIIFLNVYVDRNEKDEEKNTSNEDRVHAKHRYVKISYRGQSPYSEPRIDMQALSSSKNPSMNFHKTGVSSTDNVVNSGHSHKNINETINKHRRVQKTKSDGMGSPHDSDSTSQSDTISEEQTTEKSETDRMNITENQTNRSGNYPKKRAKEKPKSNEIYSSDHETDISEDMAEHRYRRKSERDDTYIQSPRKKRSKSKTKKKKIGIQPILAVEKRDDTSVQTPKKKKDKFKTEKDSDDKNQEAKKGQRDDTSVHTPRKRRSKYDTDKDCDENQETKEGIGLSSAQMKRKQAEEAPKMVPSSPPRLKKKEKDVQNRTKTSQ